MKEPNESEDVAPQFISDNPNPFPTVAQSASQPIAYWLKRFFACNPFYLVSAALLLFGLYRVSLDTNVLVKETTQLAFNFSSLQIYEILLVGTAIFLARRKIWYDSTLLVGLENLLLLVPFILISQAALIDEGTVGLISVTAGVLVAVRFGSLKRFFGELNLPTRLLAIGGIVLIVNVTLLVVFRMLQEDRSQEWGPAHVMNEYSWLLILPAVFALGNFLPYAKEVGNLLPQHRWLPAGFFALWVAGTSVHLYCLGYVYGFELRRELVLPSLWVLAWTAFWRVGDLKFLLIAPVLIVPFAAQNDNRVFLLLTALNTIIYGTCWLCQHESRLVRHLVFASVVMFVAGLPVETMRWATPHFHRGSYLAIGLATYALLCAALSRNPRLGILGALVASTAVAVLFGNNPSVLHWTLQTGVVFLLLHSLRWEDSEHPGAAKVRIAAALVWVAHSILWIHSGGDWRLACAAAALVVTGWIAARFLRGQWAQFVLPTAAVMVALAGPGDALFEVLQRAPSGLLGIAGSFFLFALGTAAALTKHRWHHVEIKS